MPTDPDSDADAGVDAEAAESDASWPAPCSDPQTLGDLVARDRRTSGLALQAASSGRTYSYRDFITTSYKSGNVFRYLGVRGGDEVLVVPGTAPEPLLALYGAAQLGAATRFADAIRDDAPRSILAPVAREGDFELPPGHNLAVHGGPPEDPSTTHWEAEVWSENPAVHPADVAPDDPLLLVEDRTYTHAAILAAAETVVDDAGLVAGDTVVVDEPIADPGVVAAGLVAPIIAGATILFSDLDDGEASARDVAPGDDHGQTVVVRAGAESKRAATAGIRDVDPRTIDVDRN
ncbi:MAG: acetyl-CoA synthetase [Halobellus sp.]|uniref:acetyl-CoA synthetase n=1 Tax=Halobellus sp. TaxID=1979212 RepID=UPI0035D4E754